LNTLKIHPIPCKDFELTREDLAKVRSCNVNGVNSEANEPAAKRIKKPETFNFFEVHATAFAKRGHSWPVSGWEIKERLGEQFTQLNQRPAECSFYNCKFFPCVFDPAEQRIAAGFGAAGKVLEKTQYCDLNLSMERACGNAFETNPWHLEVMTLTTKAIVMSRTSTLDTSSGELTVKCKLMDGIELMQLQGFDACCFRPGGAPEHQMAVHMTGNMFNGFMF